MINYRILTESFVTFKALAGDDDLADDDDANESLEARTIETFEIEKDTWYIWTRFDVRRIPDVWTYDVDTCDTIRHVRHVHGVETCRHVVPVELDMIRSNSTKCTKKDCFEISVVAILHLATYYLSVIIN